MSFPSRLLYRDDQDQIRLKSDFGNEERPVYAILSHTWAINNSEEVTFTEIETDVGREKPGYKKIRFGAQQAKKDGIKYFWIDTCCIDKRDNNEAAEAIVSMFRWYRGAQKCYVYLSDISATSGRDYTEDNGSKLKEKLRTSRWFTRGWTLQELLAPKVVEFFSNNGTFLGDKKAVADQLHTITSIPIDALLDSPLSQFSISERMRWAQARQTKKPEDRAYCLFGIFDVSIPVIYGEGEQKAFRRLQREVQDDSSATTRSPHTHWIVPRQANSLFTGRKSILQKLEETIRDAIFCPWDGEQCQIVIAGIGGQGKSEICLQLARRLRYLFWAVLWIDVSTPDIAERSFLDVAVKLSLSASTWKEARDKISNLQYPWLVVLDNADDLQVDYQDYFPSSRHGVVIVTTRNDECCQYATDISIALPGLEVEEAQELLLKAARISPTQRIQCGPEATAVATLLQSHPLAINQAGAYIARGHCTLAEYPRMYEQQRRRLLEFRPTQAQSRYGDVYATFEVSADALAEMHTSTADNALQLLSLLAVGAPSRFPLWLFETAWEGAKTISPDDAKWAKCNSIRYLTSWHVSRLPALASTDGSSWDNYPLVEALSLLKAFALVSSQMHDGHIYVTTHALVHAWARDRQNLPNQERGWLQVGCLLTISTKHSGLSDRQLRDLQPHVTTVGHSFSNELFRTHPKLMLGRILFNCVQNLHDQRVDHATFTMVQKVFDVMGLQQSRVEKVYLPLYNLTACNLHNIGMSKDATKMLEGICEVRALTLPKDDANVLSSRYELGRAYRANGQIEMAIMTLEAVVEIYTRGLPEDHKNLLASRQELARAYALDKQVDRAIAILESILEVGTRTQAEDHPRRLASRHELARAYYSNGQFTKAIGILEDVTKIKDRTFPEDHHSRLISQYVLASWLWKAGERDRAYEMMVRTVEIMRRIYEPSQPHRQNAESWLKLFNSKRG